MSKQIFTTIKLLLFMTLLLGIIYPLFITGLAQLIFPFQANGSLLKMDEKVVGSKLIAQNTKDAIYFSSRPSVDKNGLLTPSNLGLTSLCLHDEVLKRKNEFVTNNNLTNDIELPPEILFASSSGLDPHISPKAALLQVKRIAKARGFDSVQTDKIITLINDISEKPQFNILGCERVNVFMLNLELDKMK